MTNPIISNNRWIVRVLFRGIAVGVLAASLFMLIDEQRARAVGGVLDPAFGNGGKVTTHFNGSDLGNAVAVQSDGKIVVAGTSSGVTPPDFVLARYGSNGALDTSFDGDGKVTTDVLGFLDFAEAVAIQADGKIIVGGQATTSFQGGARFALIRYNSNGTLDATFGGGGKVTTIFAGNEAGIRDVVVQSDGKIVAVGTAQSQSAGGVALARYNSVGSLDTTFGANGTGQLVVPINGRGGTAEAVSLQTDGKIVVGGFASQPGRFDEDIMTARFSSSGQLDASFGNGGIALTDMSSGDDDGANDIAIQSDGKIVAAGYAVLNGDLGMVRYNLNGTLDTTFGNAGKVITDIGGEFNRAASVLVQTDGKIVVPGEVSRSGGSSYDFAVWRYASNGSLDTAFGSGGLATTDFNANSFDRVRCAALQGDGKIVLAGFTGNNFGETDFAVARFLSDGVTGAQPFDYDGDGRADISVYRPSLGDWYIQRSRDGLSGIRFGRDSDKITPADFDGDGKTDIAVYRPSDGTWYIVRSTDGTFRFEVFGLAEDLPVPGDFDADGKADISVFRPSSGTWFRLNSSTGAFFGRQFGQNGDRPVIGDFDGDGRADLAVFRPSDGIWFQIRSQTDSFYGEQFGAIGDVAVPADYDGDRRTDLAVYRLSNSFWYIQRSSAAAFTATQFGSFGDIVAPADYDGDGKADICVFRPSEGQWYRLNSSNGAFDAFPFGTAGDRPTQSAFQ